MSTAQAQAIKSPCSERMRLSQVVSKCADDVYRLRRGLRETAAETPENTRLIAALQQARLEERNAVHALDNHVKQAFPRFSPSMPDVYWLALPRS
jgi:hypothetical protein